MMPELDGYEFTRTVRQGDSNLPILMVSAKQLPADKSRGFAAGTDDYMTKPVDQEEFLYRIKALLRRAKIANEHRIVVGDVILVFPNNGNMYLPHSRQHACIRALMCALSGVRRLAQDTPR